MFFSRVLLFFLKICYLSQVKWIRVLYSDFSIFSKDQEFLISSENSFDYIEGFVIINRTGLVNSWRSSFNPKDPVQASQFKSEGKVLFCLEVAKYFNPENDSNVNKVRHFQPVLPKRLKLCYISMFTWSPKPYHFAEYGHNPFRTELHSFNTLSVRGLLCPFPGQSPYFGDETPRKRPVGGSSPMAEYPNS